MTPVKHNLLSTVRFTEEKEGGDIEVFEVVFSKVRFLGGVKKRYSGTLSLLLTIARSG